MRSRFSIIGLIASHLAVLGTVITGTLYGEVPARNHIDGCCAGSLLYRSSNRDTAFTPFQATLESGVVLLEWQPGASIILEKSSLDDSGITGEPATALAGHIDTSAYPGGPNDSVARLVLGHQEQMGELIALTSDIARSALLDELKKGSTWDEAAAEAQKYFGKHAEGLLRRLLFTGEGGLSSPIQETSDFQKEFEQRGPFDRKGRTLRDFDLRTRVFRYPCSYLIYSDEWDALAEPAKGYLYHRLHEVLTGRDQSPDFSLLSSDDRTAILEILLDTKPDLPSEWKQSRRQRRHAWAELRRIGSARSTN